MSRIKVGAVGYLNARPLVYGLDQSARFEIRYDVPSECARLLHAGAVDIGLIPSIEYQRGGPYRIVPDLAIVSSGPVASVAIFTSKPMADVQSIAMDTSSRASVALTRVLCARHFHIEPRLVPRSPDLAGMLSMCDAALIIGDAALFLNPGREAPSGDARRARLRRERDVAEARPRIEHADRQPLVDTIDLSRDIEKIDLGDVWTRMTGLPFVYAFWAGRAGALSADDIDALQSARDEGVRRPEQLAREYLADAPEHHEIGGRYLRHNVRYHLGDDERAGLEMFYRYAHETGVVAEARRPEFYR
jgi:chorismate dehydratase